MKKLIALGLAVAVGAGAVAYVLSDPGWVQRIRYPLRYEAIVRAHAKNYDIDPALLAAVIYRESKFNPKAVSSSGAIGLMQLLPETAKGIAQYTGGAKFQVEDLYDPEINVRYGAFYLRRLLRKYGEVSTALAAYNAGQANVDAWIAQKRGIAFAETRDYVHDVLRLRRIYRDAYDL